MQRFGLSTAVLGLVGVPAILLLLWAGDATQIGFTGVSLLLAAFVLNLFRLMDQESAAYIGLNLVGAGLACYSSLLIGFMPFVLLEGCWAVVATVAIVRLVRRRWRRVPA